MIALAMTMAMAKTKKGGFHDRRRSGTAVNARHREEEDEREYFETYRRRDTDDDISHDNDNDLDHDTEAESRVGGDSTHGSNSAPGLDIDSDDYLTRLIETLHEGPSREEEGTTSVAMSHNESEEDIEGQGQGYGHVHVRLNEETLVVDESDHDVDDVWYDVYDLSALGVPREGDEGDDIVGGEVPHAQPTAPPAANDNNDNNNYNDNYDNGDYYNDGKHAGQGDGDGDEDDQWNWGAVGEAGDVFYDSYGDIHDCQRSVDDANSEDYYNDRESFDNDDEDDDDEDEDDNDDDDDDDRVKNRSDRGRDRIRDRDRDGDSTDAALSRDTASSSNPRILSRARAFSIYFDKLAKLSDNDKLRDKIKFWAR